MKRITSPDQFIPGNIYKAVELGSRNKPLKGKNYQWIFRFTNMDESDVCGDLVLTADGMVNDNKADILLEIDSAHFHEVSKAQADLFLSIMTKDKKASKSEIDTVFNFKNESEYESGGGFPIFN